MKIRGVLIATALLLSAVGLDSFGKAGIFPSQVEATLDKMMNAVDHYRTAQATVRIEREGTAARTVTLAVQYRPVVKAVARMKGDDGRYVEEFQVDQQVLIVDHDRKQYRSMSIEEPAWTKQPPAPRFEQGSDGTPVVRYRAKPVMLDAGDAYKALYPQELALGVIHRSADVRITEEVKILGHSALVMEGVPPEILHADFGDRFKIWVDPNTGILLRAEYTLGGKIIESWQMTELRLDQQIPDSIFALPDLDGYSRVNGHEPA